MARDPGDCATERDPAHRSGSCTFALTVFADLTVAVEVGMILAALHVHPQGDAAPRPSRGSRSEDIEDGRLHILQDKDIPDYVTIFRIHGPFLFGATDKLEAIEDDLD